VPNITGGDKGIPEDDFKKSITEVWQNRDLFSFRISSHQANMLILPCTVVAARS
jgi:hypothetical protein